MNTAEIKVAMRARYPADAYALLYEVPNGTGARKSRSADAFVMSLWPSRGLELMGFEFKSSRSDWMNELKNPAKADAFYRFCDRWYLVVGDKTIVKPGELPPTWGLLVPRGNQLVCEVEAPKLAPEPLSRDIIAGLLRRAQEASSDAGTIEAAIKKARKEAAQDHLKMVDSRVASERNRADRLEAAMKAFEEASGIRIDQWNGGRIGAAVNAVLKGQYQNPRRDLERVLGSVRNIEQSIAHELESLKAVEEALEIAKHASL